MAVSQTDGDVSPGGEAGVESITRAEGILRVSLRAAIVCTPSGSPALFVAHRDGDRLVLRPQPTGAVARCPSIMRTYALVVHAGEFRPTSVVLQSYDGVTVVESDVSLEGEPARRIDPAIGSDELEAVVFDHWVGEELLAHRAELRLGGGAVGLGELDLDELADADVVDVAQLEAAQRATDRVALGIEDLALERDVDVGLHDSTPWDARLRLARIRFTGSDRSGTKGTPLMVSHASM